MSILFKLNARTNLMNQNDCVAKLLLYFNSYLIIVIRDSESLEHQEMLIRRNRSSSLLPENPSQHPYIDITFADWLNDERLKWEILPDGVLPKYVQTRATSIQCPNRS
jgi:hypothetical protein